jgi:hypothetical protein
VPIVISCHRVLAAGNFPARGGTATRQNFWHSKARCDGGGPRVPGM